MSANRHESAARRERVERAWPQGRIGNVFEDRVHSATVRDPHDLPLEIMPAIIHPEIGTESHGGLDTLVRAGGRDHVSPQRLRDLHETTAQAAGGAHYQRPISFLEISQIALAEGQGKMSRDDRRMGEGQPRRNGHTVDGGDLQILRISTPALNPEHFSPRTAAMVSVGAVLAAPTADPAEDGDTVVELQFDAGAHVDDDS